VHLKYVNTSIEYTGVSNQSFHAGAAAIAANQKCFRARPEDGNTQQILFDYNVAVSRYIHSQVFDLVLRIS
jgi:hypothetical protein